LLSDIASCEADIAFFAARHDADTRQWLFDDFDNWFSDPGHSRAFVLLGDAGIGKSVMAGVLAQRTRKAGHLGASYFCRHNDGTRNDPRCLLGTLASQLCDCNSQYDNVVRGEGGVRMMLSNPKLGVQELFTKLLEEPLVKCNPCQQRKLVIIDALDETEYESREDFLYLIKERFPRLPKWLVFFITSRPEETVQSRLERYNPCVRICAGNSEQHNFYQQHEQDIQRFLQKRVDFSRVPYSVEDITRKCNGLFLIAFYIVKFLIDPAHSGKIDHLSELFPEDTDDFFRENFQRVFDKVGADLYRKLFGCVTAAPSPLPVSFIPFILERENSDLDEQEVIDAVSQFVVLRTSDQTVTFLHNLIPGWLTNRRKATRKLFIKTRSAGEYLRKIFIEILSTFGEESPSLLPMIEVELQDYVSRVAIRFLCQLGDPDSLRYVFSCLTNYHYLDKRIQNGRIEIYHLLEDLKLAAGRLTDWKRNEHRILEEISSALESNVHILLGCPHLLHSCIQSASDTAQENILIPQVSAPWLEWNVCDFCDVEFLFDFNCFATTSDKKTVAGAKGRSLFLVDASTLKMTGGPFEVSKYIIEEINHLEFSPDDKFVFFGRLAKWFSLERRRVEHLTQFSEKSVVYQWGLFTPDEQCIVVKRKDFIHVPQTCQDKCCIVELLSLWAVEEMEKTQDDKRTCSFSSLSRTLTRIEITRGGPTERLLERLQIHPRWHETRTNTVPCDPTCYYCCRVKKLTESDREPSLATVRQLIIDLYPHIFQYQVWNFQTGRPQLQEVFHPGVQLNPFTYLCHMTSAFDNWGRNIECSDIDSAVSITNIAIFNAVSMLFTLWVTKKESQLKHVQEKLTQLLMRQWVQERKVKEEQELELELRHYRKEGELKLEMELEHYRKEELKLKLELEREEELTWEQEREKKSRDIIDSFKFDICRNFPTGFQDLVGRDAFVSGIFFCVSPEKKWVVQFKDFQQIHLVRTGFDGHNSNHKQEHNINQVDRFSFTNDDIYFVYLSVTGSLYALALQTGKVYTSVSGRHVFYFTVRKQAGYLFCRGSEEIAIYLTNLFCPFKFLPALHGNIILVKKSIAAIFSSRDTIMSVSSDSVVAFWSSLDEKKGFAFQFISKSRLTDSSSRVLPFKNCALSPDGKLVAVHRETKIELHSIAESGKWFSYTIFEGDCALTVVCLTFSAGSTLLLFCVQESINDPQVYVWNVEKKAIITSFKSSGLLSVECCGLSSDARQLILCGEYQIEIWEYNQRPCHLMTRTGVERSYKSVKFSHCAVSSDNELLVCCIANMIIIYSLHVPDVHSSKRVLRGHLGRIEFCKFLKVNRYLISYGVDGMVFLWDVTNSTAAGFVRVAQGNENILSMAVSPEEDRVVCFTSSGRICEIKLCKLECAFTSKLLTAPTKGNMTNLVWQSALSSMTPPCCVEDDIAEASRGSDLEEDYYLTVEDFVVSDESD